MLTPQSCRLGFVVNTLAARHVSDVSAFSAVLAAEDGTTAAVAAAAASSAAAAAAPRGLIAGAGEAVVVDAVGEREPLSTLLEVRER